jgi:hypothetical protein
LPRLNGAKNQPLRFDHAAPAGKLISGAGDYLVMNTFVLDEKSVQIPKGVKSLSSFRRWANSDEFPDSGRICFLDGEVWVDMSQEQFFSHNQLKNELAFVLTGLAKKGELGRYVPDGMMLSNSLANLSSKPDGAFVSEESFESSRVRLI